MTNILALDTATDACSVALSLNGEVQALCEQIPRQHNQRVFAQLDTLLAGQSPAERGIEALAYTHGPGSFTGLRIAASVMQGLAFAEKLPVVGVSTLACIAQGAWRRGELGKNQSALVILDARLNEIYWGLYQLQQGLAQPVLPDAVSAPALMPASIAGQDLPLVAIGNGLKYIGQMPGRVTAAIAARHPDSRPDSRDLLPLAEAALARGEFHSALNVHPVYLRNEISWKKVHEQGR